MTLERLRDQARRWARVHSEWNSGSGVVDGEHLNELIQIAIDQMAIDVHGFPMEAYPAISAEFTTRTHMGFHLLVEDSDGTALVDEDIAITSTNRDQVSGTTVASDLQTQLRAATGALGTETVTWTSFYFTINLQQGATFTFSAPTSVTLDDVTDALGLTGASSSSTTVTGTFPEDCTVDVTLPTDCIAMERVEWDGRGLEQVSRQWAQSPEASASEPWQYHIRGRELNLIPSPTKQGTLHVWYKGHPAAVVFAGYQECGLSDLGAKEASGLSASTTYYFTLAIDNQAAVEYSITTGTDVSVGAVLALMNAEVLGAEFTIEGGDIRCTSDTVTGVSTIALSAGSSGTDLFATLTGFSAFETSVDGDTTPPTDIPDAYHQAIARFTAAQLLEENHDEKRAAAQRYYYDLICRQYVIDDGNKSTSVDVHRGRQIRNARVTL